MDKIKFNNVFIICVFLFSIITFCCSITEVEQAFMDFGITPDVVPVAPTKLLSIVYPSGAIVNLGAELTPLLVKDQPTVTWESEPGVLYTLLIAQPDVPTREDQSEGEARHWLVINIPDNSVDDGLAVAQYLGSGAPEGSDLHRYTFLIFRQPDRIDYDGPIITNHTRAGRMRTKYREFVDNYNLGVPEYGNFFVAQYDEYVPILNELLKSYQLTDN